MKVKKQRNKKPLTFIVARTAKIRVRDVQSAGFSAENDTKSPYTDDSDTN